MLTRELVLKALEVLPEAFTVDDLDRTVLEIKIEIARKEIADGKALPWEDVKREMDSWD